MISSTRRRKTTDDDVRHAHETQTNARQPAAPRASGERDSASSDAKIKPNAHGRRGGFQNAQREWPRRANDALLCSSVGASERSASSSSAASGSSSCSSCSSSFSSSFFSSIEAFFLAFACCCVRAHVASEIFCNQNASSKPSQLIGARRAKARIGGTLTRIRCRFGAYARSNFVSVCTSFLFVAFHSLLLQPDAMPNAMHVRSRSPHHKFTAKTPIDHIFE
jgi:hypothetical protein